MVKGFLRRLLYAGLPVPGWIRPIIVAGFRAGIAVLEAAVFIRKLFWVEPVLRSVCRSVGKGLRAERLPYIRGQGNIVLGDRVNLSGRSCFYFMSCQPGRPSIEIGDGTFIGNGCTLTAAKRISIGSRCLVSPDVRIQDNDGHLVDPAGRLAGARIGPDDAAEVVIGANVWVCAGATVLKGVRIGDNSVIGAGSVVVSDVPANSVAAGNPARVVSTLTPPAGEK